MAQYWLADIPGTTISSSEGERIAVLGRTLSSTGNAARLAGIGTTDMTATALEIKNTCDGVYHFRAPIASTALGNSYSITTALSGKILLIGACTANVTMSLPAEAAGLNYQIVYVGGAEEAQNYIITSDAAANYFIGGLEHQDLDGETVATVYANSSGGNTNSVVTLVTPGAGTHINLYCDGTHWYIWGKVVSATVCTIADS